MGRAQIIAAAVRPTSVWLSSMILDYIMHIALGYPLLPIFTASLSFFYNEYYLKEFSKIGAEAGLRSLEIDPHSALHWRGSRVLPLPQDYYSLENRPAVVLFCVSFLLCLCVLRYELAGGKIVASTELCSVREISIWLLPGL